MSVETGAPLRNAQLRLSGGGLCAPRSVAADENARYGFENLPGGRFTLTAAKAGYVSLAYGQRRPFEDGHPVDLRAGQTIEQVNFALPRGGVIVAHVTDEFGEAVSGVQLQVERYAFAQGRRRLRPINGSPFGYLQSRTDDRGEVRLYGLLPGEYYVSAPAVEGPVAAADQGRWYLTTYYPGTPSAALAERVVVQAGREVNVSFPLALGRLVRLSGVVRASDGSIVRPTTFTLQQRTSSVGLVRTIPVQADGSFEIRNIAPGDYAIAAVLRPANSPSGKAESALVPIAVTTQDVTGIVVATGKGGALLGRFVHDVPPSRDPPPFRFALQPGASSITDSPVFIGAQTFRPDLTFELTGVVGQGVVRLQQTAGWFLKAVMLGERDVIDETLDFTSGADLNDVRVIVTERAAEIGGAVAEPNGVVSDYSVVLFPQDRAQWTPTSRFIAAARPDQQGRFRITGLPPGQYLMAAVDYLETGTEYDPELLMRLTETAMSVVLDEGETKNVTLTLIKN